MERLQSSDRQVASLGLRSLSSGAVEIRYEWREADDPWKGVQPRYEKIVRPGPGRFGLVTKLPSGEPITVPLSPLAVRYRRS